MTNTFPMNPIKKNGMEAKVKAKTRILRSPMNIRYVFHLSFDVIEILKTDPQGGLPYKNDGGDSRKTA